MNQIFLNNLLALATKDKELADRIRKHIPQELPKLLKKEDIYNIYYNDRILHNAENPLLEAKEIFNSAVNEPVSIHLIYGLGLGYLFQLTSLDSKGTVILYEPDLTILKFDFSLIDFSQDIFKKNVHITDNYDDVVKIIYEHSNTKNIPQILSLPSQNELHKEELEDLTRKLQNQIGSFMLDLKFSKEKFYPSLQMLLRNIPNLINETPLAHFKDAYKGKTAVVVSAGPTLDRNIETLQKYRKNYILFTVGTALKTLIKNNLTPDFLCNIETFDNTKQFEGLDLSKINFITEPYSNPNLRNHKYKQRFSHISANTPINHLWSEICGENIEEYWSKGTVSYTAINSARLLGCDTIILVGQDLAYIEGQCYSKDSAYKDLVCTLNKKTQKWEIKAKDLQKFANALSNSPNENVRIETAQRRLDNLNSSLHYVKGIQGDMIPTESVYAAFVKPLSEYAEHYNKVKYINTSLVGAQIDGYENVPLEEALKNSKEINCSNLIDDKKYNLISMKTNLKKSLEELNTALEIISQAEVLGQSMIKDIKNSTIMTKEILLQLKEYAMKYWILSSDFSNKSKMFDFITASDKIDLDYEMKMTKEFTIDSVTNIYNKIALYLKNAKERILEINSLAKDAMEKI